MIPPRIGLILFGTCVLAGCADVPPYGGAYPYPQQPYSGAYPAGSGYYGQPQGGQYAPPTVEQPQQPRPPAQSDYLPHLSQEYRNGWDIGARDRQTGYPRDYRRGYERFGRGYESYFQEGYEDGYDGRPIRH